MKNRGADNWLKYPVVVIKGACMGAADVVPGVSGGTIALLMGERIEVIYKRKSRLKAKISGLQLHDNASFADIF